MIEHRLTMTLKASRTHGVVVPLSSLSARKKDTGRQCV